MTQEEYRAYPAISRSDLFKLKKSPLHYKYATEHHEEPTPALNFGSAAHKFILEREDFDTEFAIAPNVDKRTKEGKAIFAEFQEKAEGKTVISIDDFEKIKEMAKAVEEHPIASELIKGQHEVSLFWTDEQTGEECKVRPDCIHDGDGKAIIVDYKTTASVEDGAFEKSCRKYGYKLQSGMYREGYFQNFFEDAGFAFIAQEKEAPYAVRVYQCTDEYMNEGFDEYRALIGLYHECKLADNYRGFEEIEYLYGEES